jgi:predicted methyltransferase
MCNHCENNDEEVCKACEGTGVAMYKQGEDIVEDKCECQLEYE